VKSKHSAKIYLLSIVLMVSGTLVNISNPDNVPIGIALIAVSAVLLIVASFISFREVKHQEKLKEVRLKQLEDDVASLKQQLR